MKHNINDILSTLWPLVAVMRYIWLVLPAIFLVMLGLTITKWVEYARKKDDQEYKQTKKSIIKSTVIYLVVIPIVISILLGIISGVIAGKFIPQIINNWKDTGDGNGVLTAEGAWKTLDFYTGTDNSGGLSIIGIPITLPVNVDKSGLITNFDQIKGFLSAFITV